MRRGTSDNTVLLRNFPSWCIGYIKGIEFLKFMPKGNPSPIRTDAFLARQQPRYGDRPLAPAMNVRFSEDVDKALREMPNRQIFIRSAVEKALAGDEPTPAGISVEQLQPHINAVLASIPPGDRRTANRLFKKLLDQISK